MNSIGIIGLGVVGGAVRHAFERFFSMSTYDIDPDKSTVSSVAQLVKLCGFIFITLPTPMKQDGSCDLANTSNVLKTLNEESFAGIVIIKSSIPPGTTQKISKQYLSLNIVFNPEFLNERSANQDFEKQDKVILGGNPKNTAKAAVLFKKVFPSAHIHETDFSTAEMVKFTVNCFLAVKVSMFNELYQVCNKLNVDYDKMLGLTLLDHRIGTSHTNVPGWDSHFGFGGSCFPANVNIMMSRAKELGVDPKMLQACWEKNLEVRPQKDWEQLKGRCVN